MARVFTMHAGSYFEERYYVDDIERDGRTLRLESVHRSIESYFRALASAGFVIEAV
jgi:hypothetical protein